MNTSTEGEKGILEPVTTTKADVGPESELRVKSPTSCAGMKVQKK